MKYLIILALLIPQIILAQLDMRVYKIPCGNDSMKIINNNQITFQNATVNDVMYVKKKDGTIDEYTLSDVNYIVFNETTGFDYNIDNNFKLDNYPNPLNNITTITFTLERRSKVDLNIYEINGNIVKTLISEYLDLGEHKINWDGSNTNRIFIGSGSYFYMLKVNNEVITKKFIIIK